jgi:hypothetical protein
VLNIPTEHDFQDPFKKGRNAGNGACARKRAIARGIMASMQKVCFGQMAAPVPEISDCSLYVMTDHLHFYRRN